jgi:hypothetical protein
MLIIERRFNEFYLLPDDAHHDALLASAPQTQDVHTMAHGVVGELSQELLQERRM